MKKGMPVRGSRTATSKSKAMPFGKPETKANEAKEMKMVGGNKAAYARMEKKMEGKKSTSKM